MARIPCFVLFVLFAVKLSSGVACAGSTATRCDARGCIHVHCNATGDRCYRYSDNDNVRLSKDHYLRGASGYSHRVCDSDGDRCYASRGRHWDFREYYRRLGYRWNDEGH
ncbi:MAG TPA: hypothetical protein VMF67_09860 [Rhizomicrobium sp.]|nr:hypothetical protein [Rhizomicrobium sp.]